MFNFFCLDSLISRAYFLGSFGPHAVIATGNDFVKFSIVMIEYMCDPFLCLYTVFLIFSHTSEKYPQEYSECHGLFPVPCLFLI